MIGSNMKVVKNYFLMLLVWVVAFFLIFIGFCTDEGLTDAQLGYRMKLSMLIALALTVVGAFILLYNKAQKNKAYITGFKADVCALEERRKHQLEQANKVLDKYLDYGKGSKESEDSSYDRSPVKKGADFKKYVETNPVLNCNEAVVSLMNQINKVEDELVKKKEQYNACAAEYNSSIHAFPVVLVRKLAKMEDYELLSETDNILTEDAVSDEDLGI